MEVADAGEGRIDGEVEGRQWICAMRLNWRVVGFELEILKTVSYSGSGKKFTVDWIRVGGRYVAYVYTEEPKLWLDAGDGGCEECVSNMAIL